MQAFLRKQMKIKKEKQSMQCIDHLKSVWTGIQMMKRKCNVHRLDKRTPAKGMEYVGLDKHAER